MSGATENGTEDVGEGASAPGLDSEEPLEHLPKEALLEALHGQLGEIVVALHGKLGERIFRIDSKIEPRPREVRNLTRWLGNLVETFLQNPGEREIRIRQSRAVLFPSAEKSSPKSPAPTPGNAAPVFGEKDWRMARQIAFSRLTPAAKQEVLRRAEEAARTKDPSAKDRALALLQVDERNRIVDAEHREAIERFLRESPNTPRPRGTT